MTAEQRALLAALRAVPGVAAADLEDDGHPGGAGALRLRLTPGADEVAVAAAVNRVLRTRFGLVVDVDRVQVLDDPDDLDLDLDTDLHPNPHPDPELHRAGRGPAVQPDDAEGRSFSGTPAEAAAEPPRWLGLAAADEEPDAEPDDQPVDQPEPAGTGERARVRALRVGAVRVLPAAEAGYAPVLPLDEGTRPRAAAGTQLVDESLDGHPGGLADRQPDEHPVEDVPYRSTSAGRGLRLALRRVQLRTEGLVSTAAVTLGLDEGSWTGEGEAAATPTAVQRAVAVATARAVEAAIGGVARVEVEHVDVPVAGRERTALVVVSVVTGAGAERLSGASVVRQDVRQAVVRATLAAVNRRVEGWLPAGRVAG